MNHTVWFDPGKGGKARYVEVEHTYWCARWPPDTELIHTTSQRPVVVKQLEFQGFWMGYTARHHKDPTTGHPLERYITFPMYLVRVPSLHEERYLHEHEMQPA